MSQIFISYSRKDSHIAEKIVSELEKGGLKAWIDRKDIPKGEKLTDEIYHGIEQSEIFLLLISPDSVQSKWCIKEIDHAVKNGKRILPVEIHDTAPEITHPEISERKWIHCRDKQDDFLKAIAEIRKTINADNKWLKFHTRLQSRALDWEQHRDDDRLLRGKELSDAEQQLAIARKDKDPHPTDLQRQFVKKSRIVVEEEKRKTSRRNRNLFVSISLITVLAVTAALLATWFSRQAEISLDKAQSADATAQAEIIARVTAETVAGEQEMVAKGRQLATQAQRLPLFGTSMITSGLLSVEAAHLSPDLSAQQALSNFLIAMGNPIARFAHEDKIFNAAISPDNQLIATGDTHGNIKVWDINSSAEITRMKQDGSVWSLQFSPTGDKIASAGGDLIIWNSTTGEKLFQKSSSNTHFLQTLFSQDGKAIVALSSTEQKTRLVAFDANNGDEIYQYEFDGNSALLTLSQQHPWAIVTQEFNHEYLLLQVIDWAKGEIITDTKIETAYNIPGFHLRDNKILSIGKEFGTVEIWDVYNHNTILSATLCGFSGIRSMAMSPDTKKVAVGCDNGVLVILNSQDLQEIMEVKQNNSTDQTYDPILTLSFNFDASRIITGGGTAITWDINNKQEIARMPHDGNIRFAIHSPQQDWVISGGSNENFATVWRPENGLLEIDAPEESTISSMAFDSKGNLTVASYPNVIRIWDIHNKQILHNQIINGTMKNPVIFSADGLLMVSASYDNTVKVFDSYSGKELSMMEHEDWIEIISIDPEGKFIVSGGPMTGYIKWDLFRKQILEYMDRSTFPPALSPDWKLIGYVDWGSTPSAKDLIIEDMETGLELLTIVDGNHPISFSKDNSLIAFTNFDFRTLRVWDIKDNFEIFSSKHDAVITSTNFNTEGTLLITTSSDGVARIWDTSTGDEIARVNAPSRINAIAIDSSDRVVIAYNNSAYSWRWNINSLLDEACRRLPRNLTHAEWNEYIGEKVPYRPTCPNLPVSTE